MKYDNFNRKVYFVNKKRNEEFESCIIDNRKVTLFDYFIEFIQGLLQQRYKFDKQNFKFIN